MKLRSTTLLIIWLCSSFQLAMSGILDLPDCGNSVSVSKDQYLNPKNSLITRKSSTRSLTECLVNCWKNFPLECNAIFRSNAGLCYELNGATSTLNLSSKNASVDGYFMKLMTTGELSNCNGRSCSSSEVCMVGCGDTVLENPVCIAGEESTECGLRNEYTNIRHYWSTHLQDGRDIGRVMIATYPKSRADSGLRVIIHMAVRGHCNRAGFCHHWYLTFDGNKCTNPDNIEVLDYSATTGDLHRAIDIDGTCYGLDSGDRVVELVVGPCDGYGTSDAYSGWNSVRTMLIMEMVPPQVTLDENLFSCPLLNGFNYKYETWNEEVDQTVDLHADEILIKEVTYKKVADDTSLRIKYSALTALVIDTNAPNHCARWFVKIEDSECSPQLDYVIPQTSPNNYAYWRDHRRTRTLEGICDNVLPEGTYTIRIYVGRCTADYIQPTRIITGGFNSPSRLHIEEVRRDLAVDGVTFRNHQMYRSHSGNLERFYYWASSKDEDVADLYTITYVKEYADTGLRLTASGDHRIVPGNGYSHCGRWYFKIDNAECSSPGKIEGVYYFNYHTNMHYPMQVSGICHGISLGSHTITYAVGLCSGYNSHTNALTGWQSSFHIFVEELRVDLVKICSSIPVNCDA